MIKRTFITGCILLLGVFTIAGCDTSEPEPEPIDVPQPRVVADTSFTTTSTGLKYFDFVVGTGPEVKEGDTVTVHYTGWLTNGFLFDSSVFFNRNPFPVTVGITNVILGWTEGLQGMQLGGERQLVIPPQLAYGETGRSSIPPNATLIFEVEIITHLSGD